MVVVFSSFQIFIIESILEVFFSLFFTIEMNLKKEDFLPFRFFIPHTFSSSFIATIKVLSVHQLIKNKISSINDTHWNTL